MQIVQKYQKVVEDTTIIQLAKRYNTGDVSAQYQEPIIRYFYGIIQQISQPKLYKDRNWVKQDGIIIGIKYCYFTNIISVFDNEASKEVNQYEYIPKEKKVTQLIKGRMCDQPTYIKQEIYMFYENIQE